MTPLYKRSDVLACIQDALWWKMIKSCQRTWLPGFRVTSGVRAAQVLLTFKQKRNIPNAKSSWNSLHVSRRELTVLHAVLRFAGMWKIHIHFIALYSYCTSLIIQGILGETSETKLILNQNITEKSMMSPESWKSSLCTIELVSLSTALLLD